MLPLQVAIDGPAGAGKSTVAKLVAKRLGAKYINTGAMYRAIGWLAFTTGVDERDEEQILRLAQSARFTLTDTGIIVNDLLLTDEIRTVQIAALASSIAQLGSVREVLVKKQRELAGIQSVVMDGRDIGTHVLPDADVKIFLTASVEERVKRRYIELKQKGEKPSLEELRREIVERDHNDKNRQLSPLCQAPDAIQLDTTHLTTEQVVERIMDLCRTKIGGEE